MAVIARSVSVGDATPVLLWRAKGTAERKTDALLYVDHATNTVHVGGPAVTNNGANKGVPVTQGNPLSVSGIEGDWFYAVSAAGQTTTVIILENGY